MQHLEFKYEIQRIQTNENGTREKFKHNSIECKIMFCQCTIIISTPHACL